LDLDLIEKGELDTLQKDIAEIERMLKTLMKSLENRPLDLYPPSVWWACPLPPAHRAYGPEGILGPSSPTKLEKNLIKNAKGKSCV